MYLRIIGKERKVYKFSGNWFNILANDFQPIQLKDKKKKKHHEEMRNSTKSCAYSDWTRGGLKSDGGARW